jgi:hypothetical protein
MQVIPSSLAMGYKSPLQTGSLSAHALQSPNFGYALAARKWKAQKIMPDIDLSCVHHMVRHAAHCDSCMAASLTSTSASRLMARSQWMFKQYLSSMMCLLPMAFPLV